MRLAVLTPAVLAAGLALSPPAMAQVIAVGEDGSTTVYSGPTLFTADHAEPIGPSAPRADRAAATLPPGEGVRRAAEASGLSPQLIAAVAWRESRFRPGAVSSAGAIGEMQLMPSTARALGVNPYDSAQNYRGGATYLAGLMRRYDGDLVRSLAAYNAGPQAVDRYGGVPPYRETRAYVAAVLDRLAQSQTPSLRIDPR